MIFGEAGSRRRPRFFENFRESRVYVVNFNHFHNRSKRSRVRP